MASSYAQNDQNRLLSCFIIIAIDLEVQQRKA